jgi:flagellar L-ring protein precursor FlgH
MAHVLLSLSVFLEEKLMNRFHCLVAAALGLLLAGCASTPPTSVHQPMTARPGYQDPARKADGSIYRVSSVRPLFEDRRARHVGDILTVRITERNQASSESASNAKRSGGISAKLSGLDHYPFSNVGALRKMNGLDLGLENENSFSGGGDVESANTFSGTITVTVIEVFPNGNLLVSGEKQVSIGQQQEFIRLSGIVNPRDIQSATYSVDSSRIADARIEFKGSGYVSDAQVMGWLSRFFLSVMPF